MHTLPEQVEQPSHTVSADAEQGVSVVVLPVQREQLRHTASSVSVHGENSHSVLSAAHAVHDEQTRPLLLVGGTDSNVFSGTHSSRGSQTRSFSGDGAMLSNSDVALQGSECGAHTRSLLAVGADVWYLPAKQADTSAQKRLLDAVGAAVSYWLAPHTRTPARPCGAPPNNGTDWQQGSPGTNADQKRLATRPLCRRAAARRRILGCTV